MPQTTRRKQQQAAILRARRETPTGLRSLYHYDTDAQMLVFADLHRARSARERAVR